MSDNLQQLEGRDAIIEIGNKERSACKLVSAEESDGSIKLRFESIFPVRELNNDPDNPWQVSLSRTVFGESFTFESNGSIENVNSNVFVFNEADRNLEIKLDFSRETVQQTMTKYIDELIPRG